MATKGDVEMGLNPGFTQTMSMSCRVGAGAEVATEQVEKYIKPA